MTGRIFIEAKFGRISLSICELPVESLEGAGVRLCQKPSAKATIVYPHFQTS